MIFFSLNLLQHPFGMMDVEEDFSEQKKKKQVDKHELRKVGLNLIMMIRVWYTITYKIRTHHHHKKEYGSSTHSMAIYCLSARSEDGFERENFSA